MFFYAFARRRLFIQQNKFALTMGTLGMRSMNLAQTFSTAFLIHINKVYLPSISSYDPIVFHVMAIYRVKIW